MSSSNAEDSDTRVVVLSDNAEMAAAGEAQALRSDSISLDVPADTTLNYEKCRTDIEGREEGDSVGGEDKDHPGAASASGKLDKASPPEPPPAVTISEVTSDPSVLSHFVFVSPDEGTPAAEALAANAAINVSKGDKLLHKLRGLKRPKLKSLNVMKQLKKYTKQNTDRSMSKNIKGKVIDGVHELYTLTAGMMLGMRVAIGHQTRPNDTTSLKIEDFPFVEKINFPAKGNNRLPYCTPPHSLVHTFKFKSYAPKVSQG